MEIKTPTTGYYFFCDICEGRFQIETMDTITIHTKACMLKKMEAWKRMNPDKAKAWAKHLKTILKKGSQLTFNL
jgi:hypothetical protein